MNEQITAPQVRVIDDAGEQVGVIALEEARAMATGRQLDLVEVARNANPPVCRIMDHGKYMFDRQKRERDKRKVQSRVEVKEIRLSPRTGEHDVAIAVGKIQRFIADGSRVKVRVRFRGRERFNQEVGRQMLRKVAQEVADFATVESEPSSEGNTLIMVLLPATQKSSAPARQRVPAA